MPTRDQIAAQRQQFVQAGYQTVRINHGAYPLEYFILPQKLCTELPNFAMQMVADDRTETDLCKRPEEVTLFGVCENIPVRFREYAARHEMYEYINRYSCVGAAVIEMRYFLDTKPDPLLRNEYLFHRLQLFQPLPAYASRHNYPPAKVAEFTDSQQFFLLLRRWDSD